MVIFNNCLFVRYHDNIYGEWFEIDHVSCKSCR